MNAPQMPDVSRQALDLGRLLGQRRALTAVAGRCTAAHAQLLRRIHDEKLYLPLAATWEGFCGPNLAVSRRHADRLISLLNRFGPIYFELSQLVGISPREYLAIEPAVREHSIVVNGEAISLIPENAPKILEAVGRVLHKPRRARRGDLIHFPETLRIRVFELTRRGRDIANRLVALYNSSRSESDRELIRAAAAEIRTILMQLGLE